MEYGLIGEHLSHSYSVDIHRVFANYRYQLVEVSKDKLDEFLTRRKFKAINVTIPYKETVIPYLDYVSDEVKAIGACNTIVNQDGKLYGYNTDVNGLESLINKSKIEIKNKRCLLIGNGGASKAAQYVLKKLNAKEILIVTRTKKEGTITYDEIPTDIEVIINCSPVGMYPKCEDQPMTLEKYTKLEGVIDVIYNPLKTNLILEAESCHLKAIGGLYMLVSQGFYASQYFQNKKLDPNLIDKCFVNINTHKRNIVLTGMPTSGKTTLGRKLAKRLNKKFVDTDEAFIKKVGMNIPTYFKEFGETKFREMETKIISDLSSQTNLVIATGGGAILKDENIKYLKRNGRIYFLDRPLELLFASDKRPLSSSKEKLQKVYDERYERYLATCDVRVDGSEDFPNKIAMIIKEEQK